MKTRKNETPSDLLLWEQHELKITLFPHQLIVGIEKLKPCPRKEVAWR